MYIFKIAAIGIHVLNTYLSYKITGKKKFAIIYGLNPFILFEMITNAHNDIYLIFFMFMALYFLIRKRNIILTVAFMALATCVKYVSILLVPFLVLYYLRDKKIGKKILYCFLYALLFIGVLLLVYMLYAKDLTMFLTMTMQQGKYRESILAILLEVSGIIKVNICKSVTIIFLLIFLIIYLKEIIFTVLDRNNKFSRCMRNYNNILLMFIFLIITNLCPWYTSWIIPTIFWQRSKMIKNLLYLQFSYEFVTLINFALFSESYKIGLFYLPIMVIIIFIFNILDKPKKQRCINAV